MSLTLTSNPWLLVSMIFRVGKGQTELADVKKSPNTTSRSAIAERFCLARDAHYEVNSKVLRSESSSWPTSD